MANQAQCFSKLPVSSVRVRPARIDVLDIIKLISSLLKSLFNEPTSFLIVSMCMPQRIVSIVLEKSFYSFELNRIIFHKNLVIIVVSLFSESNSSPIFHFTMLHQTLRIWHMLFRNQYALFIFAMN